MVPSFYALVLAATLWFALLWATARLGVRGCTGRVKLGFGIAIVLIPFLSIGDLPLWSWAFSFCPNPSLPMLGMVCAGLGQRLFGIDVLKPADWRAAWRFGAIAGTALYLHPMLVGSVDLYYWGWDREAAAWCLAALSAAFLASGNRHGVLLLAALLAFALDALESANCWDYVVDPFYWLVAVIVCVSRALKALVSQRRNAGRAPALESGGGSPHSRDAAVTISRTAPSPARSGSPRV